MSKSKRRKRTVSEAEQLLGEAWESGVAGNWSEKALAKGLRPSSPGADSGRGPTPEEFLRKACKEGLHPKA